MMNVNGEEKKVRNVVYYRSTWFKKWKKERKKDINKKE